MEDPDFLFDEEEQELNTSGSPPSVHPEEDAVSVKLESTEAATTKTGKKKGKKPKGAKKGGKKLPKDFLMNSLGQVVPVREFLLSQNLESTTMALKQLRDKMEYIVAENQGLHEQLTQQDKDALEVVAAYATESEQKNLTIKDLRNEMEKYKEQNDDAHAKMVANYESKINELSNTLNDKETALRVMHQEFAVIKDFRKKRHELVKELEYQKNELEETERRHKETVARMEKKFFEEKIRLQKEVNRKISELATKAHKEAVANLQTTTKEVYRENIRMSEALKYHLEEGTQLGKANNQLQATNRMLSEEKDMHNVIVKEKILQTRTQSVDIKELKSKIYSMEHSLSHVVREFEHEREILGGLAKKELDDVRKTASRLKSMLDRKTQEMKHIRNLAQHVLSQRTQVEKFFIDALDLVRKEVKKEKEAAAKAAQIEFNRQMRHVLAKPSASHKLPKKPKETTGDINELSWEDKERVLRLLFAQMNGVSLFPEAVKPDKNEKSIDELRASGFIRKELFKPADIGKEYTSNNSLSDYSSFESLEHSSQNEDNNEEEEQEATGIEIDSLKIEENSNSQLPMMIAEESIPLVDELPKTQVELPDMSGNVNEVQEPPSSIVIPKTIQEIVQPDSNLLELPQ